MKEYLPLLVLLITICIGGCGGDSCPVESPQEIPELTINEKEAIVKTNSYMVLIAVEEFAAENDGWYPTAVDSDTTNTGKTLVDFLPGGVLLVNPFTDERTEPRDMRAGGYCSDGGGVDLGQGETGYWAMNVFGRCTPLYVISGRGSDTILVEISNRDELEYLVIQNCLAVQKAALLFAQLNNGLFPGHLRDTTLGGETLIDLLPGGTYLTNPFTKIACDPVDAYACAAGQVGYCVVSPSGVNIGYTITGCDGCAATICILTNQP